MRRYGIRQTYSIEGEQLMAPSKGAWREAIRANSGRHDSVARAARPHPTSAGSSPDGPTILHKFQGLKALRPRDFSCVAMGSDSLGVTHSKGMDLKERWPFFLILLYYNSRHQAG
jgi:hypothetical protein